jgi:hypothetical protein
VSGFGDEHWFARNTIDETRTVGSSASEAILVERSGGRNPAGSSFQQVLAGME